MKALLWCRLLGRHHDAIYYVGHNIGKACQHCARPGLLHMTEIEAWRSDLSWAYRRGGEHEVAMEAEEGRRPNPPAGP